MKSQRATKVTNTLKTGNEDVKFGIGKGRTVSKQ